VAGLGPRQHFEAGHPDEFVVAEGTHDNAIVKPGREAASDKVVSSVEDDPNASGA